MSGVYMSPVFIDVATNESRVTVWEVRDDKFYIFKKTITCDIDESMKKEFVRLIKQKIKDNDYLTLTQMIKYLLQ